MEEKYTSSHIANYFLSSACDENIIITPLKLMKMVYFSYAWYLYLSDKNLFKEDIQAWKHGPVIPSLYHEFKHFGLYGDIRGTYATYIDLTQEDTPIPQNPIVNIDELESNSNLNAAVCGVWYYYKNRNGDELEQISHQEGSVWQKYYKIGQNIIINDTDEQIALIKERAKIGYEKALKELGALS